MARKKYSYKHYVNNVETSREDFIKRLEEYFVICDTNYYNPLLNIGLVDYKSLFRLYNRLKRTRSIMIYSSENRNNSFRITREEIMNAKS